MALHTNESYTRDHWAEWNGVGDPPPLEADFETHFDLESAPEIPPEGEVALRSSALVLSWGRNDDELRYPHTAMGGDHLG